MRTLAFVFCAFLAALLHVPASAQFFAPKPPATNYLTPHDSREQTPPFVHAGRPPATQRATIKLVNPPGVAPNITPGSTCYAIRSYNYAPSNPVSEIPPSTGMTTCVAAAGTHVRSASAAILR